MRLVVKKRISTLNQYREFEKNIKEGFKGIIFWAILMIAAGNSYLNQEKIKYMFLVTRISSD